MKRSSLMLIVIGCTCSPKEIDMRKLTSINGLKLLAIKVCLIITAAIMAGGVSLNAQDLESTRVVQKACVVKDTDTFYDTVTISGRDNMMFYTSQDNALTFKVTEDATIRRQSRGVELSDAVPGESCSARYYTGKDGKPVLLDLELK
ncbi:MAG: hypothetical protein HQL30_06395 [Candidatus Omnitrophica bacterium]|nr:hypothetical protein [Candidatus Omnitrophota bacterium]